MSKEAKVLETLSAKEKSCGKSYNERLSNS
jgi:hypothetical protein